MYMYIVVRGTLACLHCQRMIDRTSMNVFPHSIPGKNPTFIYMPVVIMQINNYVHVTRWPARMLLLIRIPALDFCRLSLQTTMAILRWRRDLTTDWMYLDFSGNCSSMKQTRSEATSIKKKKFFLSCFYWFVILSCQSVRAGNGAGLSASW